MVWRKRKEHPVSARPEDTDEMFLESVMLLGQLREAAALVREAAEEAKQAALALRTVAEKRIKESGGGTGH